jgi:hypothetical protein
MKLHQLLSPYLLVFALISFFVAPVEAELPYAKIKSLYAESEFDKIRVYLETFLRNADSNTQIKEKIFANKYLGVVYAAEPQGAPIARSYFMQMLELAPTAHVFDLYVSNGVEQIFLETRARFQRQRQENTDYDEFGNPRDSSKLVPPPPLPKIANPTPRSGQGERPSGSAATKTPKVVAKPTIWPWLVGAGLIAAAAGGYFLLNTQPKSHNTVLDATPPKQ